MVLLLPEHPAPLGGATSYTRAPRRLPTHPSRPVVMCRTVERNGRTRAQNAATRKLVALNKARSRTTSSRALVLYNKAGGRTPAQNAATRKLVALNKARRGGVRVVVV